jgi:hypothetical protein
MHMIEPFLSGKSCNHHPHWSKVPLRLTKEQKSNPLPVFDEFFESYHLQEVRELLWNWMVEVISSPNGISSDHHERNNHLFFYEKIEALVEAAFVLRRRCKNR